MDGATLVQRLDCEETGDHDVGHSSESANSASAAKPDRTGGAIRATLPNKAPVAAPLEGPSEGNGNIEAWILQAFGARLPIIAHVARLESRKFTPGSQGRKVEGPRLAAPVSPRCIERTLPGTRVTAMPQTAVRLN